MTESDWTRKYRRALLERSPSMQKRRILEAREAMTKRCDELEQTAPERTVIDRALGILSTLREVYPLRNQ